MIQLRGSLNNFFINNVYKLKNKQDETQPHFVLNIKNSCDCFSKKQNNENIYLKKPNAFYVNTSRFLLIVLLIDFIALIRQKFVKKGCFIYKKTIKKIQGISKKENVFIKNATLVFLQQQTLKQQKK